MRQEVLAAHQNAHDAVGQHIAPLVAGARPGLQFRLPRVPVAFEPNHEILGVDALVEFHHGLATQRAIPAEVGLLPAIVVHREGESVSGAGGGKQELMIAAPGALGHVVGLRGSAGL